MLFFYGFRDAICQAPRARSLWGGVFPAKIADFHASHNGAGKPHPALNSPLP